MKESDLHKLLHSLRTDSVNVAANRQYLKARLIKQYKNQQTSARSSFIGLITTVREGYLMNKTFKKHYLSFSPLALVLAVVITGTVGAASYWFATSVISSQHGNDVRLTVSDCASMPLSNLKAVGSNYSTPASFNEEYKILKPQVITEKEIADAKRSDCEQRATADLINKQFPDMQEFSATTLEPNSRGLYFPIYETGTVVKVAKDSITITDLDSLKPVPHPTADLELSPDVLVLDAGRTVSLAALKPGDKVYFAYQNKAIEGETIVRGDIDSLSKLTDVNERSVIRGIGRLQIDYHAWNNLIKAINSKAVEVLESDPSHG